MTLHNQTQKEWALDGFGVCECEKNNPRVIDGRGRGYYDEEQLFDMSTQKKCCKGGSDCACYESYPPFCKVSFLPGQQRRINDYEEFMVRTSEAETRKHLIKSLVGSIFIVGSVILTTYLL